MTFAEKIRQLAKEAPTDDVRALLEHAAELEQARPKWKVGQVRMKQRNCPGCKDGVVFRGQERVTPSA